MTSTRCDSEQEHPKLSRAEIDQWITRQHSKLRAYVRLRSSARLRAREPASDILQSALREVCAAGDGLVFDDESALRRYLYAVVTHKIVSKSRYHRAAQRNVEVERSASDAVWDLEDPRSSSPSQSESRMAELREDLAALARAFDTLSEEDRQILSMRRIFELSTKEVAAELGIAESTVRWRMARILSQLSSRLG